MKKIWKLFLTTLLMFFVFTGALTEAHAAHPVRLVDRADLLDSYDEEYVLEYLNRMSEELQFDLVVVTVDSAEGKSSRDYADDYFDYNGYGMGENYDGALLLVNMETREWYISTTGYGIQAIHDGDIEYIGNEVACYLSDGEYAEAFVTFAEYAADEVSSKRDSETLTVGEIVIRFFIAVLAGGALAFIPVTIMKKKLNNVAKKTEASDYIVRDKVAITERRDLFLYQTISRERKPENNSSTHRGSSGRSHGGGGGRF